MTLTARDTELWAAEVITRVGANKPVEDARVELKSGWPTDFPKAARRLAAHANAAMGEPVLWMIGVDEDQGVVGADRAELSSWYPRIAACFDQQVAPTLSVDLVVSAGTSTCVALVFATDQAPFVVRATNERLEVPWREGTRVRSARRDELLTMLRRAGELPQVRVVSGRLDVSPVADSQTEDALNLYAQLYVEPKSDRSVIFSKYRVTASVRAGTVEAELRGWRLITLPQGEHQPGSGIWQTPTMRATADEVVINGPGMIVLRCQGKVEAGTLSNAVEAVLELAIRPAGSDRSVELGIPLTIEESRKGAYPALVYRGAGF